MVYCTVGMTRLSVEALMWSTELSLWEIILRSDRLHTVRISSSSSSSETDMIMLTKMASVLALVNSPLI